MTEKSHAGLAQCFFCQQDSVVVLDTRIVNGQLRKSLDRRVGIIDMTPCSDCAGMMQEGVIVLTVRDGEMEKIKAEREALANKAGWLPNPYRTGGFFCVKDRFFERLAEGSPENEEACQFAIKHRWMFMPHSAAVALGFPIKPFSEPAND